MTRKIFAVVLMSVVFFLVGCGKEAAITEKPNTAQAQASPVAEKIPVFTTQTITGETVTNEIFAAKKITVVNIWGTFCPPCIAEMPELGEMARSMPANAQIIGLVCDTTVDSPNQIQKALQIINQAGASFVNIVPDSALLKFMKDVTAVPTTIFINSKGEVVGKAIIGADVEGYKHELEKLLKK